MQPDVVARPVLEIVGGDGTCNQHRLERVMHEVACDEGVEALIPTVQEGIRLRVEKPDQEGDAEKHEEDLRVRDSSGAWGASPPHPPAPPPPPPPPAGRGPRPAPPPAPPAPPTSKTTVDPSSKAPRSSPGAHAREATSRRPRRGSARPASQRGATTAPPTCVAATMTAATTRPSASRAPRAIQ